MKLLKHDLEINFVLLVINLGIIKLITDLTFSMFSVYNTFFKAFCRYNNNYFFVQFVA